MSTISASTTTTTAYKVTADTTGTLVLQTGATPTTAVTIDGSQNTTLAGTLTTSAKGIAKASLPAGSVLQVVNATYGSTTTINNSTLTAVGLSASITPTSATSKILVLVSYNARKQANNTYVQSVIYKNGSSLLSVTYGGAYTGGTVTNSTGYSASYLDSPATTSSTTYALYAASAANLTAIVFNPDAGDNCTMTLMEIAA